MRYKPGFLRGAIIAFVLFFVCGMQARAQSLLSPTSGNIKNRVVTLNFGANWPDGSCGGLVKLHNGVDVQASVGETIYAAHDGYVRVAQLDSYWGGWVTLDYGPTHTTNMTTVYWHIIPSVSASTWVLKGQPVGHIADLGSRTHFHFGIRYAIYDNTSNAGALPQTTCGGYPAFPASFTNPWLQNYEYNPH